MKQTKLVLGAMCIVFLFFLTFSLGTQAFSYGNNDIESHKGAAALKIIKINNMTLCVVQGKPFKFPVSVNALMSDGKIVSQKITWNLTKLSTLKVKSYTVVGKVKGYSGSIKLIVKVLPKTPTKLSAMKSYTGWIKITWDAVSGASGYNLYYSNDEESWEKWNNTVTKNSAMLSGVENGVELYFRVTSVANGIESRKSTSAYFTMLSKHMPQYPNLPVHPDFLVDKIDGSSQETDGVYYYKYTTSRVGSTFAKTYYEKALKREEFVYDLKKIIKTTESGENSKYGKFTQDNTDSFFSSADETYVIRRVVINGILDSASTKEDYFLVFRK